jgi:hypothetical protein
VPLGPPVYMHTAHACDVFVASSLQGPHFKDTGFYILHYVACQISGTLDMGGGVRTNLSFTEKVKSLKIGLCIERTSATPAINIIAWVELSPSLPPSYSSHMAVVANNAKNVTPEFPRIR